MTACPLLVRADEGTSAPDFAKLRIGALREILDARGLECRGCAEKSDFVTMARENYHLPIIEKRQAPEPETTAKPSDFDVNEMMRQMGMDAESNTGDPETDAILKKLKAKGINIAGKNGLAGMDIEQLRKLEQTIGGMGGMGTEKGGRGKQKRRKMATEEESSETKTAGKEEEL